MSTDKPKSSLKSLIMRRVFSLTLFFSALTGFAQMPIFKRYYIADIKGFGWLGEYFITYWLHYIGATVLIALAAYMLMDFLLSGRRVWRITVLGYIRGVILFLIISTGLTLVFRNLPGYRFSPKFIMALDFSHLGLMLLYMFAALASLGTRRRWLKEKTENSGGTVA